MVYGLVKPLYQQGEVLAHYLGNNDSKRYQGSILSTQLKISGVDLFSVGDVTTSTSTQSIASYDEINHTYKKIIFKEDKAIGAILYGDTTLAPRMLDVMKKNKFIRDRDKSKLLDSIDISTSYAATVSRNENICTCNQVSKGTIIDEAVLNELETVDEVKACTKASSSCGGCKPVVQELLTYMKSDAFDETVKNNQFCSCTDLTEEDIIYEIQSNQLQTVEMVMNKLNWRQREVVTSVIRRFVTIYKCLIQPVQTLIKRRFTLMRKQMQPLQRTALIQLRHNYMPA
ncbi:NasB nitrate/nitrite reduction [Gracilibacillus halophilus YIM-C55.5]|uniref:NasB nitrate/nitrite reduction n=1 Tax=Gracilibacillus halophilus YIM-C55.5 TaxID=1308866 RepID=N4WD33_9BACI|nr:(2Fe-2S)-binding protein [Gracilibacillus halophilus]ENH97154.1 NasB nitrate/nitrite reduction [Gracilibacillus halophilus YIM-C55.5]